MPSETDIVNLALVKLGDEPITSLTDNLPRAKVMNRLYGHVRDATLRAHPWNFAVVRIELAEVSPAPTFGFTHQFQLPPDCLRVLKMDDDSITFAIEGRKLLTNNGTAKIVYVKQITDTNEFDTMFIDIFATRLAAEASQLITNKAHLIEQLWTLYARKLSDAKTVGGMESSPTTIEATTLLDVR